MMRSKNLVRVMSLAGAMVCMPMAGAAEKAPAQGCGGIFPLCREWAGDATLPRPYGIAGTYYYQDQDYDLNQLGLNGLRLDPAIAGGTQVSSRVSEWDVQADVWVLPFLNVFAIAGHVSDDTTVKLPAQAGAILPQIMGGMLPPAAGAAGVGSALSDLKIEEDGPVYGGGATLTGGIGRYWAAVTVTRTITDLGSDSQIDATTVQPKIGIQFDTPWKGNGASIWFGGMYQKVEETHTGSITLTGLAPVPVPLSYDVELEEEDAWNWQMGLSADFDTHWMLNLDVGFGSRQNATVSVGYRF